MRRQNWRLSFASRRMIRNANSDVVSSVAYSPDGQTIAASYGRYIGLLQKSRPGQAILWDARTGKRRFTLSGYSDGVSSVVFSPDGRLVAHQVTSANSSSGRRKAESFIAQSQFVEFIIGSLFTRRITGSHRYLERTRSWRIAGLEYIDRWRGRSICRAYRRRPGGCILSRWNTAGYRQHGWKRADLEYQDQSPSGHAAPSEGYRTG